MRIAVIGAGVSGCLVARLLATRHHVVLFESAGHAGGHAQTVDVELDGKPTAVDVAFMVFNDKTYPNFCRLLELLAAPSRPSDMSFSVQDRDCGLEYQGSGLRGLFAQRRNAIRPSYLKMLGDILRFNRFALRAASDGTLSPHVTVGDLLRERRFGSRFLRHYLAPMAAAIWSSKPSEIERYPARFLIGFFANHGLLQLKNRPQWRTVVGGSRRYVEGLLRGLDEGVRLADPVVEVNRSPASIKLKTKNGAVEAFDQVVFATHADTTLELLKGATSDELAILGALPYQSNRAVLHTDASILPARSNAWASWNYSVTTDPSQPATVTYDLGRLQGVAPAGKLLLTLNDTSSVPRSSVLAEYEFSHPAYSLESVAAQQRWAEISGRDGVHYCGAYWGYGFHEDGVRSALAVARHFNIELEACTAACTKAPSRTIAAIQ